MSDHNAISFSLNTFYTQVEKPKVKVAQNNFLNFDNSEVNALTHVLIMFLKILLIQIFKYQSMIKIK